MESVWNYLKDQIVAESMIYLNSNTVISQSDNYCLLVKTGTWVIFGF